METEIYEQVVKIAKLKYIKNIFEIYGLKFSDIQSLINNVNVVFINNDLVDELLKSEPYDYLCRVGVCSKLTLFIPSMLTSIIEELIKFYKDFINIGLTESITVKVRKPQYLSIIESLFEYFVNPTLHSDVYLYICRDMNSIAVAVRRYFAISRTFFYDYIASLLEKKCGLRFSKYMYELFEKVFDLNCVANGMFVANKILEKVLEEVGIRCRIFFSNLPLVKTYHFFIPIPLDVNVRVKNNVITFTLKRDVESRLIETITRVLTS